jgi:uncharacterized protein
VNLLKRVLLLGLISIAVALALASALVAENAVHIWVRAAPVPDEAAAVARSSGAQWEAARVVAHDSAALDAWIFTPRTPNGAGVILLHGVGDTRAGVLSHASFLLRAGYTVLTPDCRGHGASGGAIFTYGVREAADVSVWANWLFATKPIHRLYGLGESMGAAILIQSLPIEPRFRAIVAESPFATFREVAAYRLRQESGLEPWTSRPILELGLLYTRLRYRVNLAQASPAGAIRSARVPVLLIHGTRDTNIPLRQSEELHALNPRATTLWIVPGAEHVAALGVCPGEYTARVLDWFRSHP